MTQDEALALLKTGASIFLTGQPGSGKTHTVNRYLRELQRQGVRYAYTASTGIAATHGHGVTIHAWSGIGVRETLNRRDLDALAANRRLAARIEKTEVLIIDEISMLPARALSLVDAVCRHVKGSQAPFGGLQVVLVGDFFQLPPVVRRDRDDAMLPLAEGAESFGSEFAHVSPAWRDLAPTVCYLSEQHRQSDAAFLDVLAAIRSNTCAGTHREHLTARLIGSDQLPAACTRLFTHNASVDDINQQQLAKLAGKAQVFDMVTKGPEAFVRTLKRSCLSPESLELKQGAVVMFTKNDPAGRYVNGTLGVVDEFDAEDGYPVVRTRGGKRILAEPSKWKIEENGKERASITQVPVRLAWAMTVHKSQGMSLDAGDRSVARLRIWPGLRGSVAAAKPLRPAPSRPERARATRPPARGRKGCGVPRGVGCGATARRCFRRGEAAGFRRGRCREACPGDKGDATAAHALDAARQSARRHAGDARQGLCPVDEGRGRGS